MQENVAQEETENQDQNNPWAGWGTIQSGFEFGTSVFNNLFGTNDQVVNPDQPRKSNNTVWYVVGGVLVILLIVLAVYAKSKK